MRILDPPLDPAVRRWPPPEPKRLPELRQTVQEHQRTRFGLLNMAGALRRGSSSRYPHIAGAQDAAWATALVLCEQESQRLSDARLCYADEDMTGLAVAAGQTAPTEAITVDRLPSPSGLLVLAVPIGSYEREAGGSEVPEHILRDKPTPIVGVSWSLWSPAESLVKGGRPLASTTRSTPRRCCPWTRSARSGRVISEFCCRQPELMRDNERALFTGRHFPESGTLLGTTGAWAQIVYTAWQLMAQEGKHAWT
ncbi:MAG: hypothetical protein JO362_19490 [Streptomycetaceae bacterium]|nr:hypothetical protein [Streptomycetaceae bacterium]